MNSLLSALKFLTIIPVKTKAGTAPLTADSLIYFPAAGLVLGIVLACIQQLLSYSGLHNLAISAALVVALIILTGGMHLDGLSDTFDGLASWKGREDILKIMRDPHAGAIGVLSMISAILLKIAFIASLKPAGSALSLILMTTISRWSMVLAISFFPYAREQGKAKVFMDGKKNKFLILSTLSTMIVITLSSPLAGFAAMITSCAAAYIIGKMVSLRIGGITGDVLGAINEINEIIILLTIILLQK